MMFCFNQVAKRNMIGNLALQRDQYELLKKNLLLQIADELKQKKSFPSLFELADRGN
jgi:hypothetical protein